MLANLRKALLVVALALAAYKFTETFADFSFSPRDEIAASKAAEAVAVKQEAAAIAAAPPLIIDPSSFPTLTYTGLSKQLRSEGFSVRCYGNLERKEKLYPSITQICWTKAQTAWGIPLEGISFHFAGETLQLVRIEFPNSHWDDAKSWFDGLPGEMAGSFGADVAWSWLMDALTSRSATHHSASGTSTKTLSKGFGALAAEGEVGDAARR